MYRIIQNRRIFYVLSALIVLSGIVSLATRGLNLGIDFTSGTLMQVEFSEEYSQADVENVLSSQDAIDIGILKYNVRMSEGGYVAMIRTGALSPQGQSALLSILESNLEGTTELGVDKVDPIIGRELIQKAFIAIAIAVVAVLIYIAIRFEYLFAVSGVIALLHDVFIVLSIFSIFQVEINSPFVAAILTVFGYSINDTIVIYDRIRENISRARHGGFEELVNVSINQTLVRSVNTSATTFVVVLALFLFGASSIRDLTLAFLIGVVVGTYSSIFIASAIWVDWKEWQRAKALHS